MIHRATISAKAMRLASFGDSAAMFSDPDVAEVIRLHKSAGVNLHSYPAGPVEMITVAVELDAWEEAAYRGVMP